MWQQNRDRTHLSESSALPASISPSPLNSSRQTSTGVVPDFDPTRYKELWPPNLGTSDSDGSTLAAAAIQDMGDSSCGVCVR